MDTRSSTTWQVKQENRYFRLKYAQRFHLFLFCIWWFFFFRFISMHKWTQIIFSHSLSQSWCCNSHAYTHISSPTLYLFIDGKRETRTWLFNWFYILFDIEKFLSCEWKRFPRRNENNELKANHWFVFIHKQKDESEQFIKI